jgi:hypothetical protein
MYISLGLRNHFFVFYGKKLYWAIFTIFNRQYSIPVYPGWDYALPKPPRGLGYLGKRFQPFLMAVSGSRRKWPSS